MIRTCHQCGYDLSGRPVVCRCPECGAHAQPVQPPPKARVEEGLWVDGRGSMRQLVAAYALIGLALLVVPGSGFVLSGLFGVGPQAATALAFLASGVLLLVGVAALLIDSRRGDRRTWVLSRNGLRERHGEREREVPWRAIAGLRVHRRRALGAIRLDALGPDRGRLATLFVPSYARELPSFVRGFEAQLSFIAAPAAPPPASPPAAEPFAPVGPPPPPPG